MINHLWVSVIKTTSKAEHWAVYHLKWKQCYYVAPHALIITSAKLCTRLNYLDFQSFLISEKIIDTPLLPICIKLNSTHYKHLNLNCFNKITFCFHLFSLFRIFPIFNKIFFKVTMRYMVYTEYFRGPLILTYKRITLLGRNKPTIYYIVQFPHRVTVRQLFVSEFSHNLLFYFNPVVVMARLVLNVVHIKY